MVYLDTLEEWQHSASLLLKARPATARITTKYNIPNLDSPKYANKKRKRTAEGGEEEEDKKKAEDAPPRVPRATLEVKAYDPASGVTLKFKTEKSQDVGRLFAGLGRIGRHMAALPEKVDAPQDATMEDAAAADGAEAKEEPAQEVKPAPAPAATGGGGGKKKKKGKK